MIKFLQKAINYLKQKTNNSLKVNLSKKLVVLSDGTMLSRASALGTVDTSKEIVVTNTYNVKHTFKVITDDDDTPNSVLNIIVVETEDGIFEYFMKYIFEDKIPLNSDGSIDLQNFTGVIETYNNLGELTGTFTVNSGSIVAVTGQNNPCPEEDNEEDDDPDDDGNTSNGGSPGGATSGDGSDTGSDPDPNGGGEFVNPYDEEGCVAYVQTITCWCENELVGAHDHTNESSFLVIRCGSYVVTTAHRNMARDPGSDDPCGFGDTGVLIDEEVVIDKNNCDELARALNNTEFKNKIDGLKDLLETNPNQGGKESGFSVFEDANGTLHPTPVVQSPRADGTFKFRASTFTIGAAHLHTDKVHPMFSFYDLYGLYLVGREFENNGNAPDDSKPFLILVTLPQSNPQVYAIKIEDINKLNAFMENLTANEIKDLEKNLGADYRKIANDPSDSGPLNFQAALLNFIESKNIGISLYQADNNLTSWAKREISSNGQSTNPKNCNE